jgi:hypothetical protein
LGSWGSLPDYTIIINNLKNIKMANKKIIVVTNIKTLDDGLNGEKRFSLREDRENYCTLVSTDGKCNVKVGDKIIAMEQDITLKNGTPATGFYFLKHYSDAVVQADAARDYNVIVEEAIAKRRFEAQKYAAPTAITMDALNAGV